MEMEMYDSRMERLERLEYVRGFQDNNNHRNKPARRKKKMMDAAGTGAGTTMGCALPPHSSWPQVFCSSVDQERLLEFNLHLDIDDLKQQIQQLAHHRELLVAQHFMTRQVARDNARMQVVYEFYRMFADWWQSRDVFEVRKRPRECISDDQQKQFLHNIMHQRVECGAGIVGVDQLWTQMMYYETLMRARVQQWRNMEIVECEDDILVRTQGVVLATITRETIHQVFPHVLGYEFLMSQLAGKRLEFDCTWEFLFDAHGLVTRYGLCIDFAQGFARVLRDPQQVAILLGQALIGENCMLQLIENCNEPLSENPSSHGQHNVQRHHVSHGPVTTELHGMDGRLITTSDEELEDLIDETDEQHEVEAEPREIELEDDDLLENNENDAVGKSLQDEVLLMGLETDSASKNSKNTNTRECASGGSAIGGANASHGKQSSPLKALSDTRQQAERLRQHATVCQKLVAEYYCHFAQGLNAMTVDTHRKFLEQFLHPSVTIIAGKHNVLDRCVRQPQTHGDVHIGAAILLEKWKRVSWFFECLSYEMVQTKVKHTIVNNKRLMHIQTMGKYHLRLLQRALDHVFVNLQRFPELSGQLEGRKLVCWSNLDVFFDETSDCVVQFEEQMHFFRAFNDLLRDPQATAKIMKNAHLQSDGWCGPQV